VKALQFLGSSQKRVKALVAPTGSGKSAIAVGHILMSGLPTAIVTASRALQVQYAEQFEELGATVLFGRRNYPCHFRPGEYTCEEGYTGNCPFKGTIQCPSSQAEMRAATSSIVITNYDKWTASKKYGTGMSHFQQVIFDEAHEAPEAISRAMQVVLNHREIEEVLKINFPVETEDFQVWKAWAVEAKAEAQGRLKLAADRLRGGDPKPTWVKHYNHMRLLHRRLGIIATASPKDWVVDEIDKGFQFDPVRPGRYGESSLLLKIPSVIMMSATLRPKTLFMCGIGKDTFDLMELPSEFDPSRCPIYWIPTMRVDKRAESLAPLWLLFDQIAGRRRDRKGICHTISFARRDELMESSQFAASFIINERGEASTSAITAFRQSPVGTVLVSPSVGAGFDFPGRDCEWQFICKIPFPDGRSKIVKARQTEDKEYGPYLAMQKLVQMCGRGMRSEDDRCEVFLGDSHMEWFGPRYWHLAPQWFRSFFKVLKYPPSPPERL
jgi:Rad3-related DNA helicase